MNARTRPEVSRRTVTRTAAWATPVVITAIGAPAFAATSFACSDAGADPLNNGFNRSVTWFYMGPQFLNVDVAMSAQNAAGDAIAAGSANGTLQHTAYYPNPNLNYIKLAMPTGARKGDTVSITLTCQRPVENFSFTITGIDKSAQQWADEVVASPAAFSIGSRGSNVVGSGTASDPFTGTADLAITSKNSSGDVVVMFPGPVTQVTISCTAGTDQTKNGQYVGVGGFSYSNC